MESLQLARLGHAAGMGDDTHLLANRQRVAPDAFRLVHRVEAAL